MNLLVRSRSKSMNATIEQVLDAALALPEGDREELVEALIASLQPENRPPFDESWREIIQRRSAELRSGQVAPIPWAEVKRQAREKIGG
jgi:putative addiction module component (TIGR02574 family)